MVELVGELVMVAHRFDVVYSGMALVHHSLMEEVVAVNLDMKMMMQREDHKSSMDHLVVVHNLLLAYCLSLELRMCLMVCSRVMIL